MPKDPPPNPSTPPNGTYTSTCGADFSSWDGSFTYDNITKIIGYTTTSPSFTYPDTTNKSNGNAIVFDLTNTNVTPNVTVQFNGRTFEYKEPGNKAEYSGNCEQKGPPDNQDGWTATQE
jgi:hypothetical protein